MESPIAFAPMVSAIVAACAYIVVAVISVRALAARRQPGPWRWPLLGLGLLAHGISLSQLLYFSGIIDLNFFNALSLVSFLMVAGSLGWSLFRPSEPVGILLLPISALLTLAPAVIAAEPLTIAQSNWQIELHVIFALLAYAFLAVATAHALILKGYDIMLRRRPGGVVGSLPPLREMERQLFVMIGLGFILLTLTLATGFVFVEDMMAQHLVHKTVLSITAWVIYGVLLLGRWRLGWRGNVAIGWTIGGMAFLLLAYFGTKFVLELVLNRV